MATAEGDLGNTIRQQLTQRRQEQARHPIEAAPENDPFGSFISEHGEEEFDEIVHQFAPVDASDVEIDRLSRTLSSALHNQSFHRYVTDFPTSIEQEKVVTLGWKHLKVHAGSRELLHGVSGEISEGLAAIMGPSGSGKSTLLNALLMRLTVGLRMEGDVSLNGHAVDRTILKRAVGYVMQDDVASPLLTVRETIKLVCALRFRHSASREEQSQRVKDVIEMMTLQQCADNVIGDGLSGGEKKRLSIALELLSFPRILVLDEPTSALDSLDALELVRSLRLLVEQHGMTVICTIHQPQYKVFSTFTRLILLSQGHIIYDGPIDGVSSYCSRKGMPVQPGRNPADVVMDVATEMDVDPERLRRIPSFHFEHYQERGDLQLREIAPRYSQFMVLFKRGFIMAKRRKVEFLIALFQTILNGVLVGTVYLLLSNDASKSQTRLSALFYCCTNQGTFGGLSSLNVFSSERVLALRDRSSGIYFALPYYAAKMLCEVILRFPFPFVFSLVVYWLLGLENEGGHFFFFWFVLWLDNLAAISLAMMVSVWARLPEISSLVLPLLLEVCRLFGGFFIAPTDTKDGVHWIMRLSYLNWAYGALAWNDMEDRTFGCAKPPCNVPRTGEAKMAALGLDEMTKGQYVGGLIAFIVICQVLTYLGVRFVTW
jgi:ABC-type multidrug transport system ATPase subunit